MKLPLPISWLPISFMKALFGLGLSGLALTPALMTPALAESSPPPPLTVLELFTSEGCNSCPPADKNLSLLAAEPNILALSWFVDYWNYLGWTDTFGRHEYTERQRQYNRKLGLAGVYTPQLIINGAVQEVGSRGPEIAAKIKAGQATTSLHIPIKASLSGSRIAFTLPPHALPKPATLWLIGYKAKADVAIHGGELQGLTMHYVNVVTYMRKIGDWDGKSQSYGEETGDISATGADHYALLLQDEGTGPIIGAATAPLAGAPR